jgi:putative membrane protein
VAQESLSVRELLAGTSPREYLVVYLKGLTMGGADALPGASGGTIALITGIYERLITAISALDPELLGYLPALHRRDGRRAFVAELVEADVPFLLVLGAGIASAIVTVSRVVHVALVEFPALTFAFFFGLIAASAVVLYREVDVETTGQAGAALAGFAVAFLASAESVAGALPHSPPVILLAGVVAISAMILPGVSGAFLLLLFGQYEFLTDTLTTFVDVLVGIPTGTDPTRLVGPSVTIASFGVGAAIGLLTVARIIRWSLNRYRTATLAFLVSLMVGALRTPGREILASTGVWTPLRAGSVVVVALAGGLAVLLLDTYTDDLSY